MYKIIDHTADIGIEVHAENLSELFIKAAEAEFDLMFSAKNSRTMPVIDVPISIEADSVDQLMVKWLQELLYIFESRRLVLSKFFIDEIGEKRLFGAAKGLKFDPAKHEQKLSIKAVTYHIIEVAQDPAEHTWHAKVIFDI